MDGIIRTSFKDAAEVIPLRTGAAADFDNIVADLRQIEIERGEPLPHTAGFIAMHELMGNIVCLDTGQVFTQAA